jgi:hypothetical protein
VIASGMPEPETARTPSGVEIVARGGDGSEANVTEAVQALYDIVIGSMDWGSGFLTVEDALPIAELAERCGFKEAEEAHRYLYRQRREELYQVLRGRGDPDAWETSRRLFPDKS